MTRDEAYAFLQAHQPLPDDRDLTEEQATKLDEAMALFRDAPEEAVIPLFLNVFGEGDGFGTYQLVEDVVCKFDKAVVMPHLLAALASPHRSVRFWCAQIAALFPDDALMAPLKGLLESGDEDLKGAAATALGQLRSAEALEALREAHDRENDSRLLSLLREMGEGDK